MVFGKTLLFLVLTAAKVNEIFSLPSEDTQWNDAFFVSLPWNFEHATGVKTCLQNHQKMVNCKDKEIAILLANAHFEVKKQRLVVTFNCFGTATLEFVTDHKAGNQSKSIGSQLNGLAFLPRKLTEITDKDLPLPQVEMTYTCNEATSVDIFVTVFVKNKGQTVGASMKLREKVSGLDTPRKSPQKVEDKSDF